MPGSSCLSLGGTRRPFNPHDEPAVKRWLRFNLTTGSYAAIPDQKLGVDATQGTAANQPSGTTLNGNPAVSFDGTNDYIVEPIVAANSGALTRGVWFWFKPNTVSGLHSLVSGLSASGASVHSFEVLQSGTDLLVDVYSGQFSNRRFTVANAFSNGVARSYSWEEDLTQGSEATQCTVWINGTKQTGSFTNDTGTPNGQPAALIVPTGSWAIGEAVIAAPNRPASGVMGRNFLWLGGPGGISGGGLINNRAGIEAFEPGA